MKTKALFFSLLFLFTWGPAWAKESTTAEKILPASTFFSASAELPWPKNGPLEFTLLNDLDGPLYLQVNQAEARDLIRTRIDLVRPYPNQNKLAAQFNLGNYDLSTPLGKRIPIVVQPKEKVGLSLSWANTAAKNSPAPSGKFNIDLPLVKMSDARTAATTGLPPPAASLSVTVGK